MSSTTAIRAAAACLLLACGSRAFAATQEASTYAVYIADQLAYDDNLYGLPSGADVTAAVGPSARRQDLLDSVSLGADVRWYSGNQAVGVNFRVDANRFSHNDALNNTALGGNLVWDWQVGGNLSGQAGADYYRALASFVNTNYYARDLVEREDYFGSARYRLGPHWTILGGLIEADTSHSAVAEELYDFHSKSGSAGVEYASAADNTVTLDYRYTDARFPQTFVLNGAPFNSNYDEDTTLLSVKYALTAETLIQASAGYLKRNYPYSGFATFSGNIWRASLQWQPTDKVQFIFTGWRELNAYVDSESDYFVSTGGSIAPAWTLSEKLTLSLAASWENHDYIGSSPSTLTFVSRHDTVMTQQAHLVYKPVQSLAVNLTYRYDRRDSNRARFEFDNTLASADVTFKFQL